MGRCLDTWTVSWQIACWRRLIRIYDFDLIARAPHEAEAGATINAVLAMA
jgi:hypothetical protein